MRLSDYGFHMKTLTKDTSKVLFHCQPSQAEIVNDEIIYIKPIKSQQKIAVKQHL